MLIDLDEIWQGSIVEQNTLVGSTWSDCSSVCEYIT